MLGGRDLGRLATLAVLGVLVGLVGTAVHRGEPPWGMALALLLVVCAGILARAWVGWPGMLLLGLTIATTVGILAVRGPGGDVLIPAEPVGYVWYASGLAVALAALAPRSWFSDRPIGGVRR